jgi:hypothetical protein
MFRSYQAVAAKWSFTESLVSLQQNIAYSAFQYWHKRLKKLQQISDPESGNEFVQLMVKDSNYSFNVSHRANHYTSGKFLQFWGRRLSIFSVLNRCICSSTSLNQW